MKRQWSCLITRWKGAKPCVQGATRFSFQGNGYPEEVRELHRALIGHLFDLNISVTWLWFSCRSYNMEETVERRR